jgi:transposase
MHTLKLIYLKDLAQRMQFSVDTVKRWANTLGVPPTIAGHRYSERDAERLIQRWQAHWRKRRRQKAT